MDDLLEHAKETLPPMEERPPGYSPILLPSDSNKPTIPTAEQLATRPAVIVLRDNVDRFREAHPLPPQYTTASEIAGLLERVLAFSAEIATSCASQTLMQNMTADQSAGFVSIIMLETQMRVHPEGLFFFLENRWQVVKNKEHEKHFLNHIPSQNIQYLHWALDIAAAFLCSWDGSAAALEPAEEAFARFLDENSFPFDAEGSPDLSWKAVMQFADICRRLSREKSAETEQEFGSGWAALIKKSGPVQRQGRGIADFRKNLDRLEVDAFKKFTVEKRVSAGFAFRDCVVEPKKGAAGFYRTNVKSERDHRGNMIYTGVAFDLEAPPEEDAKAATESFKEYIKQVWHGAPGSFLHISAGLFLVFCGRAPGRWYVIASDSNYAKTNFSTFIVFIFTGREGGLNFQTKWLENPDSLRMEYRDYVGDEIVARMPEACSNKIRAEPVKNLVEPTHTEMVRRCHGRDVSSVRTGWQLRLVEINPDALKTLKLEHPDDVDAIAKRFACIRKKKHMGYFVDEEKARKEFGGVDKLPSGVYLQDETWTARVFDHAFARAYWRFHFNCWQSRPVGEVEKQVGSLRHWDAKYGTTIHEDTRELVQKNTMPADEDGAGLLGAGPAAAYGNAAGHAGDQPATAAARERFEGDFKLLAGRLTESGMSAKQKEKARKLVEEGKGLYRNPTHNGRPEMRRENQKSKYFWPMYIDPVTPLIAMGARGISFRPLPRESIRAPESGEDTACVAYNFARGVPDSYGSRRYAVGASTPQNITREARGAAFGARYVELDCVNNDPSVLASLLANSKNAPPFEQLRAFVDAREEYMEKIWEEVKRASPGAAEPVPRADLKQNILAIINTGGISKEFASSQTLKTFKQEMGIVTEWMAQARQELFTQLEGGSDHLRDENKANPNPKGTLMSYVLGDFSNGLMATARQVLAELEIVPRDGVGCEIFDGMLVEKRHMKNITPGVLLNVEQRTQRTTGIAIKMKEKQLEEPEWVRLPLASQEFLKNKGDAVELRTWMADLPCGAWHWSGVKFFAANAFEIIDDQLDTILEIGGSGGAEIAEDLALYLTAMIHGDGADCRAYLFGFADVFALGAGNANALEVADPAYGIKGGGGDQRKNPSEFATTSKKQKKSRDYKVIPVELFPAWFRPSTRKRTNEAHACSMCGDFNHNKISHGHALSSWKFHGNAPPGFEDDVAHWQPGEDSDPFFTYIAPKAGEKYRHTLSGALNPLKKEDLKRKPVLRDDDSPGLFALVTKSDAENWERFLGDSPVECNECGEPCSLDPASRYGSGPRLICAGCKTAAGFDLFRPPKKVGERGTTLTFTQMVFVVRAYILSDGVGRVAHDLEIHHTTVRDLYASISTALAVDFLTTMQHLKFPKSAVLEADEVGLGKTELRAEAEWKDLCQVVGPDFASHRVRAGSKPMAGKIFATNVWLGVMQRGASGSLRLFCCGRMETKKVRRFPRLPKSQWRAIWYKKIQPTCEGLHDSDGLSFLNTDGNNCYQISAPYILLQVNHQQKQFWKKLRDLRGRASTSVEGNGMKAAQKMAKTPRLDTEGVYPEYGTESIGGAWKSFRRFLRPRWEGMNSSILFEHPEYVYAAAWNYANADNVDARVTRAIELLMRQREGYLGVEDLHAIPPPLEFAPEPDQEHSDDEGELQVYADEEDLAFDG
eukprot:g6326.t1